MLILKHVRNWSSATLEREVRANVVHRRFCRIGMEKVPDAKTLVRLGQTVVESNIHYPTDSGLLNDGTRVLTRTMKKIEQKTGGLKKKKKIRDRKRSVTKRVFAIAHALRHKGPAGEEKRKREYQELLGVTRRILAMHERFCKKSRNCHGVAGLWRADYASISKPWRIVFAAWYGKPRHAFLEDSPSCRINSSVCSNRRPRSFASARQVSPTNLANWCSCRKPRTRSSRIMRCTIISQPINPRWTSENRPTEAEPEQDYLYPARGHSGKPFCETWLGGFILTSPGRRVRQRRDATGAPTQGPEWRAAKAALLANILARKR
jgi:hypothetical protein